MLEGDWEVLKAAGVACARVIMVFSFETDFKAVRHSQRSILHEISLPGFLSADRVTATTKPHIVMRS